MTSELDAVNQMLAGIGEAPINQLDGEATVDVAIARQTLSRVRMQVCHMDWHWNTEKEYPLVPDGNGYINIPSNIIWVDLPTYESTYDVEIGRAHF